MTEGRHTTQRLTVLMGSPAAGKSTWCAEHADGATVITVDAIKRGASPSFVFDRARLRAKAALSRGEDVIIDACSTRWRDRSQWIAVARGYGARTRLVVLSTPLAICVRRDRARRQPVGSADRYAARMEIALKRIQREPWDEIITPPVEGASP